MQESMNAPNVVRYGYTPNIITRLDEATYKPPRSGVKASDLNVNVINIG